MPSADAALATSLSPDSDGGALVGADPRPAVAVRLEGFEGPLDLLLDLARRQAVDLGRISLPDLADQYVAAIQDLDRVGLARAADWLIMAAWLTWLKSRLLLPKSAEEARQAERAAAVFAGRLAVAERVRAAAARLERQAQLGRDVWARGTRVEAALDGADATPGAVRDLASQPEAARLLRACLVALGAKPEAIGHYRPSRHPVWPVAKARGRVRQLLPVLPDGSDFARFVPGVAPDAPDRALRCRSAAASTLVALLELARDGALTLTQDEPPFGPIHVHAVAARLADPATPARPPPP